ncbi:hypothetical protein HanPI659440_Chr03g0119831 [Helianthus annuus]|nr:hypothetical protein HanPI659440_Chr03g0119831 [Helianthus annuus]
MNPSLLFNFFIFFIVFTLKAFSTSSISYSEHCHSYAPEATPANRILTGFSLLELITSNYTGGQNILDQDPQWQRSIFFEATRNIFKTNVVDTYKMQARLSFFQSYTGYPSNVTDIKSKGTRGGSLVIEFITHKDQSSFAMSLTIFPSLTTIFSRGGHHSPPHPTISPQPTNTLTNQNDNA